MSDSGVTDRVASHSTRCGGLRTVRLHRCSWRPARMGSVRVLSWDFVPPLEASRNGLESTDGNSDLRARCEVMHARLSGRTRRDAANGYGLGLEVCRKDAS